jgi:hypothetical protein
MSVKVNFSQMFSDIQKIISLSEVSQNSPAFSTDMSNEKN